MESIRGPRRRRASGGHFLRQPRRNAAPIVAAFRVKPIRRVAKSSIAVDDPSLEPICRWNVPRSSKETISDVRGDRADCAGVARRHYRDRRGGAWVIGGSFYSVKTAAHVRIEAGLRNTVIGGTLLPARRPAKAESRVELAGPQQASEADEIDNPKSTRLQQVLANYYLPQVGSTKCPSERRLPELQEMLRRVNHLQRSEIQDLELRFDDSASGPWMIYESRSKRQVALFTRFCGLWRHRPTPTSTGATTQSRSSPVQTTSPRLNGANWAFR